MDTSTRTPRRLRQAATLAAALALLAAPGLPATRASATTPTTTTKTETTKTTKTTPTTPSNRIPARYTDQRLAWKDCTALRIATRCAYMRVPRDWNHPDAGPDLLIAVSTSAPAGVAHPARVAFGNPGGPGGPGLSMAPFLRTLPGLGDHLTVGFDPRGTGRSSGVTCRGAGTWTTDPRDRSRSNLALIAATARQTAATCTAASHGLLPYITTQQTVHDMDLLRALLGYDRIDYLGYSGGTWLGAYYETYFRRHVGRFVLDSNTDFTRPWSRTVLSQPQAIQRRFTEQFAVWAARYDTHLHLGSDPAAVDRFYETLRADLARRPVTVQQQGRTVVYDGNYLDTAVTQAMYAKKYFAALATGLLQIRRLADAPAASTRTLRTLPTPLAAGARPGTPTQYQTYDDGEDATFLDITCNDTAWPRGQGQMDALSARLGRAYPIAGWSQNQQPCAYWHRPRLSMPVPDGRGLPTTLMVQGQFDPATDVSLAADAHRRFAGSRLISVSGEGDHGVFGGTNACVGRLVGTWFGTGRAPSADVTCRGDGIPGPPSSTPAPATPLERISAYGAVIEESIGAPTPGAGRP